MKVNWVKSLLYVIINGVLIGLIASTVDGTVLNNIAVVLEALVFVFALNTNINE